MVSAQPDPNSSFRRVTRKMGEVQTQSGDPIEVFATSIENPEALDRDKPANLVDFRTNPNVPSWMKNQGDPSSRWQMLAALLGIEVGYSKEFINWKLWGISPRTSEELRAGFSKSDPGYLSDYGKLGIAAKTQADGRGLEGEERLLFCLQFISDRVEATPFPELGLFGAWLSGAKIESQRVKQVVREAMTT